MYIYERMHVYVCVYTHAHTHMERKLWNCAELQSYENVLIISKIFILYSKMSKSASVSNNFSLYVSLVPSVQPTQILIYLDGNQSEASKRQTSYDKWYPSVSVMRIYHQKRYFSPRASVLPHCLHNPVIFCCAKWSNRNSYIYEIAAIQYDRVVTVESNSRRKSKQIKMFMQQLSSNI